MSETKNDEKNNFLISQFNGWTYKSVDEFIKDKSSYELHNYQEDWNKLIPVCRKFDQLYSDNWSIKTNEEYVELSNKLDYSSTLYEILPLYKQLLDCIKWFNSQTMSTK